MRALGDEGKGERGRGRGRGEGEGEGQKKEGNRERERGGGGGAEGKDLQFDEVGWRRLIVKSDRSLAVDPLPPAFSALNYFLNLKVLSALNPLNKRCCSLSRALIEP